MPSPGWIIAKCHEVPSPPPPLVQAENRASPGADCGQVLRTWSKPETGRAKSPLVAWLGEDPYLPGRRCDLARLTRRRNMPQPYARA